MRASTWGQKRARFMSGGCARHKGCEKRYKGGVERFTAAGVEASFRRMRRRSGEFLGSPVALGLGYG